jgi:hypothetical protein
MRKGPILGDSLEEILKSEWLRYRDACQERPISGTHRSSAVAGSGGSVVAYCDFSPSGLSNPVCVY